MQEEVIQRFENMLGNKSNKSSADGSSSKSEKSDLNDQNENLEDFLQVRVRVLEEQLQTNARNAAAEISALKMRVFELEMKESLNS